MCGNVCNYAVDNIITVHGAFIYKLKMRQCPCKNNLCISLTQRSGVFIFRCDVKQLIQRIRNIGMHPAGWDDRYFRTRFLQDLMILSKQWRGRKQADFTAGILVKYLIVMNQFRKTIAKSCFSM